ncbi:MAG TPA: aldehyde dehydrogenase family protein [Bacilli bacterium]|nr:aldehyde dehydrogenase family protein [Bacilli bacterium]HQC83649.1 aldehyde dehydrogenase family protein [Bacilli bacterium]
MENLIGRSWIPSKSGRTINIVNPATNEIIDTVPDSNTEDVNEAVNAARKGFQEWSKKSIYERGEILLKFNELVKENKNRLAKLLSDETGKPLKEALGEIGNVDIGVRAFVERAKHEYNYSIPAGQELGQENTMQITVQAPLGVVAAIIPFNFPSDLFCQKVPSALMMGNAVILKPSGHNPLTLCEYAKLLIEAGVSAGAINVINGPGAEAAQALASNPGVNLVSLTGSTIAGMETMAICSKNLTHTMLELGGNDAFILDKDGDVDLAVEETIWGRLYNTGQVCCASKRFLIQEEVKDEFINKLLTRIGKIKFGLPSDPNTEFGCLISEDAAKNVEEQVNATISSGAKLVCGGKRKGAFYAPTILDNVTKDMDVAKDMEIFGPVISIIPFKDINEAVEIANQSSFGLCGSIISRDINKAMKVANELECGGAIINGASFYRSFEMPFGGWKHSGIGNEGVLSTLKEMSRTKTIILKNILK